MSRFGGRGGRGRGRWWSRGGANSDLIRDNLEDLGLEQWNDDRNPPVLYPPLVNAGVPPILAEEDQVLVRKAIEIKAKCVVT